jgi:hypothetical protein
MSKKDFIALADALRGMEPILPAGASEIGKARWEKWREMVDKLADFCQSQNSQFKRDRWLSYIAGECGPNGGKLAQS